MVTIDETSRNRITNDLDTNFFVEAGAGSGKTFSLVTRMVAMVESGIHVEKICAITFTKNAANEFYDRFTARLKKRSKVSADFKLEGIAGELPAPTEKTAELCKTALDNIDLCFMGTIDSFCNLIINEHPVEAGVPSDSTVLSDDELNAVIKREYTRIVRGEAGPALLSAYKHFAGYFKKPDEVFIKLMTILINKKNCEIVECTPVEMTLEEEFRAEIDNLHALWSELNELGLVNPSSGNTTKNDKIKKTEHFFDENADRHISDILKILNTLKDITYKSKDDIPGMLTKCNNPGKYIQLEKTLWKFTDEVTALSGRIKNRLFQIALDFVNATKETVFDTMRANGELTYFDYLYYLRNMLKEDAEKGGTLIKHISTRHSYYLIDEFQDTDPLQAEIFFYLTAETPVSEWSKCRPKPGTLFIVGDPKQSIYRFRNADISSYNRIKELFEKDGKKINGEILQLTRNFRSTKQLCTGFNAIFDSILNENNQSEPGNSFSPIPTEYNYEADGLCGFFTYKTYGKKGKGAAYGKGRVDIETKKICGIIKELVGNNNHLIQHEKKNSPVQIRYDDIMIITAGKKQLPEYIRAFRKEGIPLNAEGSVPFSECPALCDLAAIFSAVANPFDAMSVYAALTSSSIGLTDKEVTEYRENGGRLALLKNDSADAVHSALSKLYTIKRHSVSLSPIAILKKLEEEYGILSVNDDTNIECYYYALELIRDAESNNEISSLREAAALLNKIVEGKSGEERCLSLADNNRVKLANLHKVKGLEAPIVILAWPFDKTNYPPKEHSFEENGEKKCCIFNIPISGKKGNLIEENENDEKIETEKGILDDELKRLLYVAATRAKNTLIIGNSFLEIDETLLSTKNYWWDLLEKIPGDQQYIEDVLGIPKELTVVESADATQVTPVVKINIPVVEPDFSAVKNSTYSVITPSRLKTATKTSSDSEPVADDSETDTKEKKLYAALRGTMVHRLMEMLASSGFAIDIERAAEQIVAEQVSTAASDYKFEIIEVGNKILEGGFPQIGDAPTDIMAELKTADEIYCEVPFCYNPGNDATIFNGVIDLLYRKDENWHIVDYKTNMEANDLDTTYQQQLDAYTEAFKHLTGHTADAKIYHIDL